LSPCAPRLEGQQEPPSKPGLEETLDWLRREVWPLPILDQRSDDEILGYSADGHCD